MAAATSSNGNGADRRREMFLSPSSKRMNAAGSTNNYAEDLVHEEDTGFLANLTVDGVKEGAYMLCKHADDVLGHHARQAFREKASSMRGQNSIYFYLKEQMKKYGSQHHKIKGQSDQLVLEAHEFRKLVTSDPGLESAISIDQIDALFHRIEQSDHKVIRHQDFVEFCLLDHHQLRLLLYKYRKFLRHQQLSDNELVDTFNRMVRTGHAVLSMELFHATLSRELDIVLTTGELAYLMKLMDRDHDGVVKISDFEGFVKDENMVHELLHPSEENGIVDIKISTSEAEETTLKRDGYTQLLPKLHDDTSTTAMYLWCKSAPREEGKLTITSIRYSGSSRDTDLVSKGFTCLNQDINRNGMFGRHKFFWISYASSSTPTSSEVIELSLTKGDLQDKNEANLYLPPHRGFKLIAGNLNEKSTKTGVFLWVRQRRLLAAEDLVDPVHHFGGIDSAIELLSPRAHSRMQSHIDDLERQVRKTLRRRCPVDQDGALNFIRLFEDFDTKKKRCINKQQTLLGIETFGIKIARKDFALLWERMNPHAKPTIDIGAFSQFLELTETEIDDAVTTVQRSMTARTIHQMPNYRQLFQSFNAAGDGRLSRSDFQRLFASNQLTFTNSEISKVLQRFDVNRDGIVDYADFLRFITGVCDSSERMARRIADAAEELRSWSIEKQNKKLAQNGSIDSSSAWKLLRPKRSVLEASTIGLILRQRNIRMDANELQQLRVLISPTNNGEVNHVAFHAFVNHLPRKVSSSVYDLKKLVGDSIPEQKDAVFDRLNVESNGKLSLVKLHKEITALQHEKYMGLIDIKDFVYLVQWTGSDCGGDGAVLIDRFLARVRENNDRRNMKNEFVTHYDSPRFVEGVDLLREEIKRTAKTPDGKYNYMIPFRLFDKDNSGFIMVSEFEVAVRELGIDKYLTDLEIKGLMRRFDLNNNGGINYEEFLRFNLTESSSKSRTTSHGGSMALDESIQDILRSLVAREGLIGDMITSYCLSLKRMFAIIDKDNSGFIPSERFLQILNEMNTTLNKKDASALLSFFGDEEQEHLFCYRAFCYALTSLVSDASLSSMNPANMAATPPAEAMELLRHLYQNFEKCRKRDPKAKPFDFRNAFRCKPSEDVAFVSAEEFKEALWVAGIRHPYLFEELQMLLNCFRIGKKELDFNVSLFLRFLDKGPCALLESHTGALDVFITRLQDDLKKFMSGKDADSKLQTLFAECDKDKNGEISREEFLTVLEKAGFHYFLSEEDHALLLDFFDVNGDGVIAYQEFLDFAQNADQTLNAAVTAPKEDPATIGGGSGGPGGGAKDGGTSPRRAESSPRLAIRGECSPKAGGTKDENNPRTSDMKKSIPTTLLRRISKLNLALMVPFDFEKYLRKHRCSDQEPLVKLKTFEKIMDKFLDSLLSENVSYNMYELDSRAVSKAYITKESGGSIVNYAWFLSDLTKHANLSSDDQELDKHGRPRARRHGSGAGHDEDSHSDGSSSSTSSGSGSSDRRSGRSSNESSDDGISSDEDKKKTKKMMDPIQQQKRQAKEQLAFDKVLDAAIKKQFKSAESLSRLYEIIGQLRASLGTKEWVREKRFYSILTTLSLRLRREDIAILFPFLTGQKLQQPSPVHADPKHPKPHDKKRFNVVKLLIHLHSRVAPLVKDSNSKLFKCNHNGTGSASGSTVIDRIYECLLKAAQQNVSGRKMLEKCDLERKGKVSVLEFQTVMRLMGCVLQHADIEELQAALGQEKSSQVNYRELLSKVGERKHAKANAGNISGANSTAMSRPLVLPRRAMPGPSSSSTVVASMPKVASPTRQVTQTFSMGLPSSSFATCCRTSRLNADESRQLDGFLRDQLCAFLRTKMISETTLTQYFQSYDIRGIGFVTFDAVSAVFRRLEITLSGDLLQRIICRFMAPSGDKVDYVELCQVLGTALRLYEMNASKPSTRLSLKSDSPDCNGPSNNNNTCKQPQKSSSSRMESSQAGKAAETRSTSWTNATAASGSSTSHLREQWSCAICFHVQTRETANCEICGAENPASEQFQVLQQCALCGFKNKPTASLCVMCHTRFFTEEAHQSTQELGSSNPQKSRSNLEDEDHRRESQTVQFESVRDESTHPRGAHDMTKKKSTLTKASSLKLKIPSSSSRGDDDDKWMIT